VPAQTQPRGAAVTVIQRDGLADLGSEAVSEAATAIARTP